LIAGQAAQAGRVQLLERARQLSADSGLFIIGAYLSAQRPWQSLAGQRAGGHNKEFRA
jgi:hypothetical protein